MLIYIPLYLVEKLITQFPNINLSLSVNSITEAAGRNTMLIYKVILIIREYKYLIQLNLNAASHEPRSFSKYVI